MADLTNKNWYKNNYKTSLKSKGRLLPLIEEQLVFNYEERNSHRDTEHLHPSEIAKKDWCPRSSWYKITGAQASPDSTSFNRLNIFEEGHAIHHKWQTWLWQAGVLYGNWSCSFCNERWVATSPNACPGCGRNSIIYREVPIQNDQYRLLGHADGIIEDANGRALLEIKSVGLGTIRWENKTLYNAYASGELKFEDIWKNIKKPLASHIRQGSLYMFCTGIDTIIFIYEWKPTQEVKEFVVTYQPEVLEDVLAGCEVVIRHLDANKVPPRPDWAYDETSPGCKFCPYKKVCWKL